MFCLPHSSFCLVTTLTPSGEFYELFGKVSLTMLRDMPSTDAGKYKTIKSCRITLFLWKPALAGEDSAFPSIDHVHLEEFAAPLGLFLPVFIFLNLC